MKRDLKLFYLIAVVSIVAAIALAVAALLLRRQPEALSSTSGATVPRVSTRETFTPTVAPTATPTSTPSPTPTPTATPTPTPPAQMRLAMAVQMQAEGRYDEARRVLAQLAAEETGTAIEHVARFRLGQAYLADGHAQEAAAVMALVIENDPESVRRRQARFLLGEALAQLGDWEGAIRAYEGYLEEGGPAVMEAWERIGHGYRQLTQWDEAERAYARAIEAADDVTDRVRLREVLAEMAMEQGWPERAVAHYDEILAEARNAGYRAEILYRAGEALRMAGRTEEAIQRYQAAADTAPTSRFAHASIVALLDLNAPVDEYQRGVINYYNGVYALAAAALERYIAVDPDARGGQALSFLARSYHALGQYEQAISVWDRLIDDFPQCPCWGEAWLWKGSAYLAMGDGATARQIWRTFADTYPQHALAANALMRIADSLRDEGDCTAAGDSYREVYRRYPASRQGVEALFAAGMCMFRLEAWDSAVADWRQLLSAYPGSEFTSVTRLWLGKALLAAGRAEEAAEVWRPLAQQPETYYGQRAIALAEKAGISLAPSPTPAPPPGPSDQELAEEWLASWVSNPPPGPLSVLPPELANDPLLIRGRELLELGLIDEAVDTLDQVRRRHRLEPLNMYRLALYFRDLGAYRLSIACAEQLIRLSPVSLERAPVFIQRLAYPTYFSDLVEPEAAARGVDPLLIYAMIRQESLFEVTSTSHAAARGLMQIIPDTGEWVATRLGWRDYHKDLLYRPYISVKFGVYYFSAVLDMLDGNIVAALAGYNAGPGNARRWLERAGGDDDLFFAEITLSEPRTYVQRILSYYATYRRLYGATTR
ncbi:MAG: transglycosylase SLT domain-containing protein [Anaerolineae bacterium]